VLTRSFPATPGAPAAARRAIEDLRWLMPDDSFESLRLVVSELVTNAVIHGSAGTEDAFITLDIREENDCVRVEVVDHGSGFPGESQRPTTTSAHGRGLFIVDQVASRWGIERDDRTKVWADVPRLPE